MYDATVTAAAANLGTVSSLIAGDVVTVAGAGTVADKNVALNKAVTLGTLALAGADAGNYKLGTGALTVTPATLTVTASAATKSYGQTPVLTAFSYAGQQNGETVGSVTESSPGTAATATVAGSAYPITPSAATGGTFDPANYTLAYLPGALSVTPAPLTVTPAPLTVTASPDTKSYGQTPALSAFTYAGQQNGETVGSVTESSPGSVTTVMQTEMPGEDLTVTQVVVPAVVLDESLTELPAGTLPTFSATLPDEVPAAVEHQTPLKPYIEPYSLRKQDRN